MVILQACKHSDGRYVRVPAIAVSASDGHWQERKGAPTMCADCDQLADLTGDDMEEYDALDEYDCPRCGETTYGSPAIIRPSEGLPGVTWHVDCYL